MSNWRSKMLSAKMLAAARTRAAQSLQATCTIKDVQHTPDAYGGTSETLVVAAANVPCWLGPADRLDSWEDVAARKLRGESTELRVAYDQAISVGQVVELEGIRFRVAALREAGTWRMFSSALLEYVEHLP